MGYFNFEEENDSAAPVLNLPRGKRRRAPTFTLRLTSMIDMFTILLVFLLKSFSAEGQIMTVAKDLRLPESTAQKPPETASVIVVTRDWILLDGNKVTRTQDVAAAKSVLIKPLHDRLVQLRRLTEKIASLSPDMQFTGNIAIQGDKAIPFEVLKKIMYTCGSVGYNNMLLAVTRKD